MVQRLAINTHCETGSAGQQVIRGVNSAGDVDIMPAGDVNEDVATMLTATITANHSSTRCHLQLLWTWNQAACRHQVHLHQCSDRQRSTMTSTTTLESALSVVMTICCGASTKALGSSRGSSTGYSVTPAASGFATSARALDTPYPLYLCALAASN